MANRGFNILEFRSNIESTGGLKLSSKFKIDVPVPKGIRPNVTKSDILQFHCKSVSLPGLGIITSDVFRYGYGPIERKPYGTVVNDVMAMMYLDGDNHVKNWFYDWTRLIVNYETRDGMLGENDLNNHKAYLFSYKEDYAVDITISFYTQEGKEHQVVLTEAYPNYLGDVMLDWDAKNQVSMLPVSFTFKDWYETTPRRGRVTIIDDVKTTPFTTEIPDDPNTK